MKPFLGWLALWSTLTQTMAAEMIFHHGHIVTVNREFAVVEAMAVSGNRIVATGSNDEILRRKQPETKLIDLAGKMLLPGLIDSHVHPGAAMTEFDHPIPDLETIGAVLSYIAARSRALPEGQWIHLQQVFITRLKEQRYPTRAELDQAAPKHPVVFRTGPDASLNSLALQLSGIDRDFKVSDGGAGVVEKDAITGEPTGILRNCSRFIKIKSSGKVASDDDHYTRTWQLFKDYNQVGLTSVSDRSTDPVSIGRYERMLREGKLTIRLALAHQIETLGPLEPILERIRTVGQHHLHGSNEMLRIIGIKTFLDGGMLTGSAYLRQPWGVSEIYSIRDPNYRGVLFIPKDRLRAMVRTAMEAGLQFTAHSVGDGAVHALLDVYEELSRDMPIRPTRPCITHCNFMSEEAVDQMARLGVVADIQPAWLYLDSHTLLKHFGQARLRWFQPLRTLFQRGVTVGGGSDHMQKIGSLRSINPYNPFLGMATAVSRQGRFLEEGLHLEEALSREQAIRFYTINNAYLLFAEKQVGSLEVGKLADFIIVDRDLLRCPQSEMAGTQVLATYVDGKAVFEK